MSKSDEEYTGIGIDYATFSELRAHCVDDWFAVLTVTPHEHGFEFAIDEEGDTVILDRDRMLKFIDALQQVIA